MVRVHTGEGAAESARAVHALAYTVGNHIVFSPGQYAPGSRTGERLLAHELAHVLQQRSGMTASPVSESVYEANADAAASHVAGNSAAPPAIVPSTIGLARKSGDPPKTPEQKIAEATAELDRLPGVIQAKGDKFEGKDAVVAYDKVHSVVLVATSSNDPALLAKARQLKSRLDSIVHNTAAAKPPSFEPHPAASQEPMTAEEASRAAIAQRGFDSGLNAQGIQKKEDEIKQKQDRLAVVEGEIKTADGDNKANLEAERKKLEKEIGAAKAQIAVSRPTLIDADPEKLRAQKRDLDAQLKKPDITEAQRKKVQARIDVLGEQIDALTSGKSQVPLSALQGGRLGAADLSSQDPFDRLQSHQKTYVTVQVLGSDGKVRATFQAHNDPASDRHAEDVVMDELRKLPDKSILKGATIVITGDQEVCDRCAPRLRYFAKDHGVIKVTEDTTRGPKLTPQGKDTGTLATAKTTTAKVSDPAAVGKMEKAQEEAGIKRPGQPLNQTYKRRTRFLEFPVIQGEPHGPTGGSGGGGKNPAGASAGKPQLSGSTPAATQQPSPKTATPPSATQHSAQPIVRKPPSTQHQATTSTVKSATPAADVKSPHGGAGGAPKFGTSLSAARSGAGRVLNAVLGNLQTELMQIANANADKDISRATNALNKILDAKDHIDNIKALADNPVKYGAKRANAGLIEAVFEHFNDSIDKSYSAFISRFPDVDELYQNPLGVGISIEEYRRKYHEALADLHRPDARKTLLYAFMALGLPENAPDSLVEARLREADEILARMPGVGEYIRNYLDVKRLYVSALVALQTELATLNSALVSQTEGVVDELRRRGNALSRAQGKAEEAYWQIVPFTALADLDPAFEPIDDAATDLKMVADGFGGLGGGLHAFADVIDGRKSRYPYALKSLEAERMRATEGSAF